MLSGMIQSHSERRSRILRARITTPARNDLDRHYLAGFSELSRVRSSGLSFLLTIANATIQGSTNSSLVHSLDR
jgi:hypothetical protein